MAPPRKHETDVILDAARAVADLPYAVVRRHAHDESMPSWLEADVAASARAVLHSFGERA